MATVGKWWPLKEASSAVFEEMPPGYTAVERPLFITSLNDYVIVYCSSAGSVQIRQMGTSTDLITATPAFDVAHDVRGAFTKTISAVEYIFVLARSGNDTVLLKINTSTWAASTHHTMGGALIGNPAKIFLYYDQTDACYLFQTNSSGALYIYQYVFSTDTLTALHPSVSANTYVTPLGLDSHGYFHFFYTTRSGSLDIGHNLMVPIAGGSAIATNGYTCLGSNWHTHGGAVLYDGGDAHSYDLSGSITFITDALVIPEATPKFIVLCDLGLAFFSNTTLLGSQAVLKSVILSKYAAGNQIRTDGKVIYCPKGLQPFYTKGRDTT